MLRPPVVFANKLGQRLSSQGWTKFLTHGKARLETNLARSDFAEYLCLTQVLRAEACVGCSDFAWVPADKAMDSCPWSRGFCLDWPEAKEK